MKHSKNETIAFTIKTESLEGFFARGKQTAKLLDHGEAIAPRKIISFEDSKDLILGRGEIIIREISSQRNKE